MKIKFTDNENQVLSNLEIHFEFNKIKKSFITNDEGIVEFTEPEPGSKISCYINLKEKQKFTFEPEKEITLQFKPPLTKMVFITENTEGKIIAGSKVFFEFLGEKSEMTSNLAGYIILENIPVNTEVKVYQLVKGQEKNTSIQKCTKVKEQYYIIVDTPPMLTNMKIKLVDKTGQAIRNVDVRIKTGPKEYDTTTGHDGCLIIENIEIGSQVECKQIMGGKLFPWHKLKCEIEIDEYIVHGERPTIYADYSDKIDSQVRMKFRLVNSKNIPIPNAVLKIEYGDKVRNKYTNQYGETIIDDVLIGDKVKVYVDIRGKNMESEYICQEDNELHAVIFRTAKISLFLWLIPVLLLIAFFVFFTSTDNGKKDAEKQTEEENQKKKDSVVISNYAFNILSLKSGKPINGVKIKLIYIDTLVEAITNQNGKANIKAFAHISPKKIELTKLGYMPLSQPFKLDSLFNLKMANDDSIDIDPIVQPCGLEFQSKGAKTSIRSIKMNMSKGKFNIWYNLFNIPTKVSVYKGSAENISQQNLLFSNNGYMKGISNPSIMLDSPDSLITVSFESNQGKTTWVYKVYCAKLPLKTAPVNVTVPATTNP